VAIAADVLYPFRRNLVVAASAGTGKTHALVGVIVHLVLGASELGGEGLHAPVDPGRIVATTFSRKAAAEVRARVVEELERLVAGGASSKYRADLDRACARAGVPAWTEHHTTERARRAMDGIGRAQIGTLHGFATTLVRAHALEAGLSPSFEIAPEDEARQRMEDAIVRVLERSLGPDLRDLVDAAGGVDRLVGQIVGLLGRIEEDGRGAAALTVPSDDARRIDETMRALVDHARALAAEEKFADVAAAMTTAWDGGDPATLEEAAGALCGARMPAKRSPLLEAFHVFRSELGGGRTMTNPERGRRMVRTWQARERFGRAGSVARALLVACQDEIAKDVKKSSLLGFGDVLRIARDVLRDDAAVAGEVSAGLDALLVDEFQDTSRLQRELVQLLWAREERRVRSAVPAIGDVRPHGLFVVGDRKQSIYGFRGADVGVFAELCVGLAGEPARTALGIAPGAAWEPPEPLADFVSLRDNRRGNAGLLAFANAFSRERFTVREPPPELYEIAYVPETEDLRVPDGSDATVRAQTTWLRWGDEDKVSRVDEGVAIAARIRAMIEAGEPRVRGNPPQFRDVAILAPTNEMLDAAAFALAQAGVPHVVAGRGFYASTEVRDLRSLLALVVDPKDKLAMLEVLRGPWMGAHDATLLGLTEPGRGLAEIGPAWERGERRALVRQGDKDGLAKLRRVVSDLWRNLDRLGPGGVLREAVRELALEEVLVLLPRGEQRVANVRKLVAMAEREPNVVRFLERLDRSMEREASESEAATFSDEDDAVRLLTIHASKGLDFPIVFLPELGRMPRPRERGTLAIDLGVAGDAPILAVRVPDARGGTLEPPSFARATRTADRRDRAERQRLAYVAATRASEAMVLVGDRKPPKSGDGLRWFATDAAALRALAEREDRAAAAGLVVEKVEREPVRLAAAAVDVAVPPPPIDPRPAPPPWRSLAIAPTSLQDFAHCARRFQLVHVLGLPERSAAPRVVVEPEETEATEDGVVAGPRLDARAEGTLAHHVLERLPREVFGTADAARVASEVLVREGIAADHPRHAVVVARVAKFAGGAYAARVAQGGGDLAREVPFVLRVDGAGGRTVALRGSIDLLVTWPDGSIEVVDYKRARGPSSDPYAFQLDLYLLAARGLYPRAPRMRAGIVFLGGDAGEPVWRVARDPARMRAHLAELATKLVLARWTESFPRVAPPRCRAIRCGYFRSCHPGEATTDPA
jgi:ATP-dependent helicase/nuclease subunit A